MKKIEQLSTAFSKTFPSTGQAHLDEAIADIRIWAFEAGLTQGLQLASTSLVTELLNPKYDGLTFEAVAEAIAADILSLGDEEVTP